MANAFAVVRLGATGRGGGHKPDEIFFFVENAPHGLSEAPGCKKGPELKFWKPPGPGATAVGGGWGPRRNPPAPWQMRLDKPVISDHPMTQGPGIQSPMIQSLISDGKSLKKRASGGPFPAGRHTGC